MNFLAIAQCGGKLVLSTILSPRWVAFLAVLGGCLACARPASAEDRVKVTVVAILASESNEKVDHKLKDIAQEVRKREPQLKGFRLASMTCRSLPVNGKETFRLVEDQVARVTVQAGADKENRVVLAVKPPLQGEITYQTVCGKFLPIVTRYQTNDKDRLII